MAGDDGAADVKNSTRTFQRWFNAARYAVALVVAVLIVTVIAHAIAVVRPDQDLLIRVRGGTVAVERDTSTGNLTFGFALDFTNPSGRARIYYTDLSMNFFGRPGAGGAASSNAAEYFLWFFVEDVDAKPQSTVFTFVYGMQDIDKPFVDALKDGDIHDAMLTLNGTVTVGVYGHNRSQETTMYYCKPVIFALAIDPSVSPGGDTMCTKDYPPDEGATIPM